MNESLVAQGQVRFVWHDLAFLGQESVWAAEAAQCAAEQGQFWAYHDKLFEEQGPENSGAFDKPNLRRFAADLGLDTGRFDACLAADRELAKVRQEAQEAREQGIVSTPTLLVNGRVFRGVPSFAQLYQLIENA